ncbi:MAG TPA: sialidase family protein, partial [Candidatus Thermoplasmatota archaeon]|nr:sialidase family protein [Candidatus Thermoplasmatota archaeon]
VYASGVCCVGKAPPVWASRDGGMTWAELTTPGVREATGIEGDFAVDDAGNLYFTDILLGAMWMTSWDKDGAWRHTTPVPLKPLVDRPWVRAGAEDVVYFLYNTGVSTELHVSTDGGRTFPPVPLRSFPAPLGTLGQGPERDDLWVVAGGKLYASPDGGRTWGEGEDVPLPPDAASGESGWNFHVPVVDEAGRVLVGADVGSARTGYRVYAAVREPDGAWSTTVVSPAGGTHFMPWPAAGRDGGFVLAWYGTDDAAAGPDDVPADAQWHVFLAASRDAGRTWQVVRADPEPVLEGPMARRLLDFLQVDLAPDGAAHVVYARNLDGTNAERMLHARTTVGLGLAPLAFPHGPRAEATEPARPLPLRLG